MQLILSPLRLPISPPGHFEDKQLTKLLLHRPRSLWGNLWGVGASSSPSCAHTPIRALPATDARTAERLSLSNAPSIAL